MEVRNFTNPSEVRQFVSNGRLELVSLSDGSVGRGTFEPGWRWSVHVQPIAGTASCQSAHTGYVVSGSMIVRTDAGVEHELNAGDVFHIPPGHDAWTIGDVPCVQVDFTGMANYAKPA